MREFYFFSVPIYRLSEELYYEQRDIHLRAKMPRYNSLSVDEMLQTHFQGGSLNFEPEASFQAQYGGAWEFNEIVGFVKLHFLGNQIRGEYWAVNSKKIVRTRKKQYEYKTHKLAPEISIYDEDDSISIFQKILNYIEACREELNKRYIDASSLQSVGQCTDWRQLFNLSRARKS